MFARWRGALGAVRHARAAVSRRWMSGLGNVVGGGSRKGQPHAHPHHHHRVHVEVPVRDGSRVMERIGLSWRRNLTEKDYDGTRSGLAFVGACVLVLTPLTWEAYSHLKRYDAILAAVVHEHNTGSLVGAYKALRHARVVMDTHLFGNPKRLWHRRAVQAGVGDVVKARLAVTPDLRRDEDGGMTKDIVAEDAMELALHFANEGLFNTLGEQTDLLRTLHRLNTDLFTPDRLRLTAALVASLVIHNSAEGNHILWEHNRRLITGILTQVMVYAPYYNDARRNRLVAQTLSVLCDIDLGTQDDEGNVTKSGQMVKPRHVAPLVRALDHVARDAPVLHLLHRVQFRLGMLEVDGNEVFETMGVKEVEEELKSVAGEQHTGRQADASFSDLPEVARVPSPEELGWERVTREDGEDVWRRSVNVMPGNTVRDVSLTTMNSIAWLTVAASSLMWSYVRWTVRGWRCRLPMRNVLLVRAPVSAAKTLALATVAHMAYEYMSRRMRHTLETGLVPYDDVPKTLRTLWFGSILAQTALLWRVPFAANYWVLKSMMAGKLDADYWSFAELWDEYVVSLSNLPAHLGEIRDDSYEPYVPSAWARRQDEEEDEV